MTITDRPSITRRSGTCPGCLETHLIDINDNIVVHWLDDGGPPWQCDGSQLPPVELDLSANAESILALGDEIALLEDAGEHEERAKELAELEEAQDRRINIESEVLSGKRKVIELDDGAWERMRTSRTLNQVWCRATLTQDTRTLKRIGC